MSQVDRNIFRGVHTTVLVRNPDGTATGHLLGAELTPDGQDEYPSVTEARATLHETRATWVEYIASLAPAPEQEADQLTPEQLVQIGVSNDDIEHMTSVQEGTSEWARGERGSIDDALTLFELASLLPLLRPATHGVLSLVPKPGDVLIDKRLPAVRIQMESVPAVPEGARLIEVSITHA